MNMCLPYVEPQNSVPVLPEMYFHHCPQRAPWSPMAGWELQRGCREREIAEQKGIKRLAGIWFLFLQYSQNVAGSQDVTPAKQ